MANCNLMIFVVSAALLYAVCFYCFEVNAQEVQYGRSTAFDEDELDFPSETDDLLQTQEQKSTTTPKPVKTWSQMKEGMLPNFRLDTAGFSVLLIVLFFARKGKQNNATIANEFLKANEKIFLENFHYHEGAMVPFSWNIFQYYATGRRNCKCMHLRLELIPRQCFWRSKLFSWVFTYEDVLLLSFPLDSLDAVRFAVCKRRHQLEKFEIHSELKTFCKPWKSNLPANFSVIAETEGVKEQLLRLTAMRKLLAQPHLVNYIYVSDQATAILPQNNMKLLHLEFNVPRSEDSSNVSSLIKASITLMDQLASLRLPEQIRLEVLQERNGIERKQILSSESFTEQEERRRLEKKKKMDERIEKMTPEQQRKHEEKVNRKQNRLKMKRI